VQLLGSGTILREVIAAAELLASDWGVAADVWSVPSFTELRRDGLDAERWNLLHPLEERRVPYVEACLGAGQASSGRAAGEGSPVEGSSGQVVARQGSAAAASTGQAGPVVAATDYVRAFADQIRPFVPGRYQVLGTDGFGRSDYRRKLRSHFEVDRHYVVLAALSALASDGAVPAKAAAEAMGQYGIDPDKPNPARV
jgi:Pyruvate dehydrogenase complex, dehydrogenase (E1) component